MDCQFDSYAVGSLLGPTQVSALFLGIARSIYPTAPPDWFFLIIQPTDKDESETCQEYRRLGIVAIEDSEMHSSARIGIEDQLMSEEKTRTIMLV